MLAAISVADRAGRIVRVGDQVRVLGVNYDPGMDDEERELVDSMIGAVGVVEGFDGYGRAWVSRCWTCSDGGEMGRVVLESHQMERVWPLPEE